MTMPVKAAPRADRRELARAADGPIWALVSGFPGERRRRRLMLMLQAYIDDSFGSSPIHVLAGFLGRADQGAEFSRRWNECLEIHPPITFFKMNEAMACQGQFRGWSEERRDQWVSELIRIARESAICSVSSMVRRDERNAIFGRSPSVKRFTPYFLTYYGVIMSVVTQMDKLGLDEPVDFIFDEQGKDPDRITAAWHDILEMIPEERRGLIAQRPIHRSDKTTLPLQAADMFAWFVNRCIGRGAFGVARKQIPNWEAMDDLPYLPYQWTTERLIKLRSQIAEQKGEEWSLSITVNVHQSSSRRESRVWLRPQPQTPARTPPRSRPRRAPEPS